MRCLIPYVNQSFVEACRQSNMFDKVLFEAFEQYENGNSLAGNQLFRDFVWKNGSSFVKGQMNDTLECLDWLIDNISSSLRSLFSFSKAHQFSICRKNENDVFFKEASLPPLPFMKDFPTMKDYNAARRISDTKKQKAEIALIEAKFQHSFKQGLLYQLRQTTYCDKCNEKCATKCNLLLEDSLPEFFFVVDPTNFDPGKINDLGELKEKDCQPYFPPSITIDAPLPVEYTLHARIYSWFPKGGGFYVVGKSITSTGSESVFTIDNLQRYCQEEKGKKSKQLSKAANTIVVCYKKKK